MGVFPGLQADVRLSCTGHTRRGVVSDSPWETQGSPQEAGTARPQPGKVMTVSRSLGAQGGVTTP